VYEFCEGGGRGGVEGFVEEEGFYDSYDVDVFHFEKLG